MTITNANAIQQLLPANPARIGVVVNYVNGSGQLFFGVTSGGTGGYVGDAYLGTNVPYALPYNFKGALGVSGATGNVVNVTEFT